MRYRKNTRMGINSIVTLVSNIDTTISKQKYRCQDYINPRGEFCGRRHLFFIYLKARSLLRFHT